MNHPLFILILLPIVLSDGFRCLMNPQTNNYECSSKEFTCKFEGDDYSCRPIKTNAEPSVCPASSKCVFKFRI